MKIFQTICLSRNKKLSPLQSALLDFITDVVVIFFLVLVVVKPFFFAPFRVQQQSMTPNVLDGELIIVWKTPYVFGAEYKRNDVVVFKPADSENYLIKRVIGLPDETIRFFEGFVWLENESGEFEKLDESFIASHNLGNACVGSGFCSDAEKTQQIDFEIPKGSYFVMGDNRLASRDSRSCFQMDCGSDASNFLTEEEIEGKVVFAFARLWEEGGRKQFTLSNMRIIQNPKIQIPNSK
ncbi:MAG: signal peptidase I [Patescibacteria group bacterium]